MRKHVLFTFSYGYNTSCYRLHNYAYVVSSIFGRRFGEHLSMTFCNIVGVTLLSKLWGYCLAWRHPSTQIDLFRKTQSLNKKKTP